MGMDGGTLKRIDRLLSLAKVCPDDVQIELLGIAAELLDAELDRDSEPERSAMPPPKPAADWGHAN
jgi:hypothetical protein